MIDTLNDAVLKAAKQINDKRDSLFKEMLTSEGVRIKETPKYIDELRKTFLKNGLELVCEVKDSVTKYILRKRGVDKSFFTEDTAEKPWKFSKVEYLH